MPFVVSAGCRDLAWRAAVCGYMPVDWQLWHIYRVALLQSYNLIYLVLLFMPLPSSIGGQTSNGTAWVLVIANWVYYRTSSPVYKLVY